MQVRFGNGTTEYGPGVSIDLTGEDVAIAISAYLVAHQIYVDGAQTITVNGELCEFGEVYVDPGARLAAYFFPPLPPFLGLQAMVMSSLWGLPAPSTAKGHVMD